MHKEYFAQTGRANYEKHPNNSKNSYKYTETRKFIKHSDKNFREKYSPDVVCEAAKK